MGANLKSILLGGLCCASSLVFGLSSAQANKLVTSDIPLESSYYIYLDKMEAMGFIKKEMTFGSKPYSRYAAAKRLAKINPVGMPDYLRVHYDAMCNEFSDEIAYIIVHELLDPDTGAKVGCDGVHNKNVRGGHAKQVLKIGKNTGVKLIDRTKLKSQNQVIDKYYADQYNPLVAQKIALAQNERFNSNVQMRKSSVELSYQKMDQMDYTYKRSDASYQPLHGNNNGHRYGKGTNIVGNLHMSGSIGSDVAVGATGRLSYDKDQKGKASLDEGYVRTHVGMWTVTAGKQPLNWATHFGNAGMSLSNNAEAHTMVQIGLLEPWESKRHSGRFSAKTDVKLFAARLGENRKASFRNWKPLSYYNGPNSLEENNKANFWGARLEFQPKEYMTLGLQHVSMDTEWSMNRIFKGRTPDNQTEKSNDQSGYDIRLKFPGVQFYGEMMGEHSSRRISDFFLAQRAYRYGVYFPQVAKDGSWDAMIEYGHNNPWWYWYGEGETPGGWVYHHDIVGDSMGNNANKVKAVVRNYMKNGDTLSFIWARAKERYSDWMSRAGRDWKPYTFDEYTLMYSHKLNEQMYWDLALGYAKIKNANDDKNRKDNSKYVATGFRWEY